MKSSFCQSWLAGKALDLGMVFMVIMSGRKWRDGPWQWSTYARLCIALFFASSSWACAARPKRSENESLPLHLQLRLT